MPIEKTIKLYKYHELSDNAKERARDWYLSKIYWPDELDSVIDYWRELAEKLGFSVDSGPWWDIDRGTFEIGRGSFYRPDDDDLDNLERDYKPNPETGWKGNPDVFYTIAAVREIRPWMSATIDDGRIRAVEGGKDHLEEPDVDYPDEAWNVYYDRAEEINEEERVKIENALSSLNHLGLKWLQDEAEYIESEEAIQETMEANEWLFHEDGSRARY